MTRTLSRAVAEEDAVGVEFALYLGHRFEFEHESLELLHRLVGSDWYERHEDVVDAIAKLADPSSAEHLYHAAVRPYPYRDWDDAKALEKKAVYALKRMKAVDQLEKVADTASATVAQAARDALAAIG